MISRFALPYRYARSYTGKLRGAVLDWSGTTADKYVIAPAEVFRKVFQKHNVPISMAEARKPMGLRKDLHIAEILKDENVKTRWKKFYRRDPNDDDVLRLFDDFVPMQLKVLRKYSSLIPGTVETMNVLRNTFKLKIGMTTGFTSAMTKVLLEETRKQGYIPDCCVAGDEVENGARPKPFMLYRNLDLMNVSPIESVLKVDDTVGGIGEGMNAGCWTCGVSRYSNYMNVDSLEHEKILTPEELDKRNEESREILVKSGAHYVVDSIEELPMVVLDINERLSRGERPN